MREIQASKITEAVKKMCISANCNAGEDLIQALQKGLKEEESPIGKEIFEQLLENAKIAHNEQIPICQDTGFAVIFLEIGQDVHIIGADLSEAINEGVRQGYKEGYLRKSILQDPISGKNTGDNTPAMIHTTIVPGEKVKITVAPKGGGSENMSSVKMMAPAAGVEGVKKFVVDWVKEAGSNPCPPIVVGVGIGGTFEGVAMLAKKALLRPIGSRHPNKYYADLEEELLRLINNTGVGPQGLGGRITALDVHVEVYPRHIASFPVAVNINCHVARHESVEI
ncbi:MAG: fumarate hydratase [Candidatus Edwardsbacteria bacterium]